MTPNLKLLLITCSSKVTMSLDAWGWENWEFTEFLWGRDVVSVEKVITWEVSVKCCCLPSGRGQDKTYPRLLLHKQAGSGKKSTISFSHFLNVQKNIFQLYIPRDTLAIWTTLGNSVRQEMGITSWKVLNFVLKGKETVWKVRMLAVQLLIQRTPPAALMIFFFFRWCFAFMQAKCRF